MQQENDLNRRLMNEMLFQEKLADVDDSLPVFDENVFNENENEISESTGLQTYLLFILAVCIRCCCLFGV